MKIPSQLITDWKTNTFTLNEFLNIITEQQSLLQKDNTGWTVLEVIEHFYITEKACKNILLNKELPIAEEALREHIPAHMRMMLDMPTKVQAPESVKPKQRFLTLEEGKKAFFSQRQQIQDILENWDDANAIGCYPHPMFGDLSQLEWIYFSMSHTNRHINQIKNILSN